jgi:tetratricopeptide (TPR) repeat protein
LNNLSVYGCLITLLGFCTNVLAKDLLARADSLYALRADGAEGDRAQRAPATAAITAYREAVAAEPERIDAHWKLLRALFFEAQYTGYNRDERKTLFADARDQAEKSLDLMAKAHGGKKLWESGSRERLAAHGDPDDAAQLYLWSAIAWAQWGRAHGAMSAIGSGLAKRLRDYGERVIELDPDCEYGGGQRLLSGLHARLPRVPFITGFVRRDKAIPLAEQALAIDGDYPGNRYLYATTVLRLEDPERREQALAMLTQLANEKTSGPSRVEWQNLCDRAQRWLEREEEEEDAP